MRVIAAALIVTLALAADARADTDGLALGVGVYSNHVAAEDRSDTAPEGSIFVEKTGGGVDLWVGWGFTPSFTARLRAAGASHETSDPEVTVDWGAATIEALYLFRNPEKWRPYILGGVGGYSTTSRQDALDFEASGPGLVMGGGAFHVFNETWALDFGLRVHFVNWEDATATFRFDDGSTATVQTPVEDDGAAVDLSLGVSWWL